MVYHRKSTSKIINLVSDKPHYEIVPFEIPESWEWVMVQDIFELNPKNKVTDEITAGFIPMELVSAGFGFEHSYTTQEWGKIKKGYSHFQNGDIGIAKISPCFENRKSTIFYNLPNNIGAGTTELVVLRGHIVFTKFFLYLFQTAWYISEGTKYFKGVVGQQRVHKDIFTTLNIPLPPLAEQQRIVAEVEKWFALIDELEANKEDLRDYIKQVKSKVLDLAIHGKLVPQDPNDEPAIEWLKRINSSFKPCDTSHYENLPAGWSVTTLSHIIDLFDSKRKPIKADERAKRIEGKDVVYPYYGATGFVGYIDEYLIEGKFLLLGEDGAPFLDPYAEKAYVVEGKFWVNNHAHILRPKIDFDYLKIYLNAFNYHDVAKGTTRLKLTQGDMNSILVTIPPLKEQRRISSFVENVFSLIDIISTEL